MLELKTAVSVRPCRVRASLSTRARSRLVRVPRLTKPFRVLQVSTLSLLTRPRVPPAGPVSVTSTSPRSALVLDLATLVPVKSARALMALLTLTLKSPVITFDRRRVQLRLWVEFRVPLVLVVRVLVTWAVLVLARPNRVTVESTSLVVLVILTLLDVVRLSVLPRLLERTLDASTLVPLSLPTVLVVLAVEHMALVLVLTVVRCSRDTLLVSVLAPVRMADTLVLKLVVTCMVVMFNVAVVTLVVVTLVARSPAPLFDVLTAAEAPLVLVDIPVTLVANPDALVSRWMATPWPSLFVTMALPLRSDGGG